MCFTGSVPSKKILHCINVSFSVHAISRLCRHTTSKAFERAIWNVTSAQEHEILLCNRSGGTAHLRT